MKDSTMNNYFKYLDEFCPLERKESVELGISFLTMARPEGKIPTYKQWEKKNVSN